MLDGAAVVEGHLDLAAGGKRDVGGVDPRQARVDHPAKAQAKREAARLRLAVTVWSAAAARALADALVQAAPTLAHHVREARPGTARFRRLPRSWSCCGLPRC